MIRHPSAAASAARAAHRARKAYERGDWQNAVYWQEVAAYEYMHSCIYECICGGCLGKCEMREMGASTVIYA